ncbi:SLATT domain-containing protein [Mycobacterium sp. NPDC048908]|uniref:SLATT domain-containing protein n=1 Tax=Mycobacterium sp. NPDC048908 TaxID=3364292 RepID=UPI003718924B
MAERQWTDDSDRLLRDWFQRARHSQHSHHEQGKIFKRRNYLLAVPVVVINTVLGTTAFASINSQAGTTQKIWFGVLSMVAAVLAALQVYFKYAEKAEQHKHLGAQYGNVRRGIEQSIALVPSDRGDVKVVLDEFRQQFDALGTEGDVVSRRIFERTVKMLAERDEARAAGGV